MDGGWQRLSPLRCVPPACHSQYKLDERKPKLDVKAHLRSPPSGIELASLLLVTKGPPHISFCFGSNRSTRFYLLPFLFLFEKIHCIKYFLLLLQMNSGTLKWIPDAKIDPGKHKSMPCNDCLSPNTEQSSTLPRLYMAEEVLHSHYREFFFG